MKALPISTLLSGTFLLGAVSLSAQVVSNYTGWMNDYDGTEAGTLYLYKFDNPPENINTPNMAANGPNRNLVVNVTGTTRGVQGKFGTGFQIDNPYTTATSVGYAQLGGPPNIINDLTTPYLSVEFWYSTPNEAPGDGLNYFIDYQFSSNEGFQLTTVSGTQGRELRVLVGNGTARMSATTSGLTWESDRFYHLAFTYNALEGELLLYRDGAVIAQSVNAEFGELANYGAVLRLGNRVGSIYRNMPGTYDNFRISDALYQYSTIPEPGTVALFFGAGALGLCAFRRRNKQK